MTTVEEVPGQGRLGVRVTKIGGLANGSVAGEFCGCVMAAEDIHVTEGSDYCPILKFAGAPGVGRTLPMVLDARRAGNSLRFITPSCLPNCKPAIWWVRDVARLAIVATKDIAEGDLYRHHPNRFGSETVYLII